LSSYILLTNLLSTHDAKLRKSGSTQSHSHAIDQTVASGALGLLKPRQLALFPSGETII
jgi:hypothetical protein